MKLIHPSLFTDKTANILKTAAGIFLLTFIAIFSGICVSCDTSQSTNKKKAIQFEDVTVESGLKKYSESFGAVFADIDNDGDDDLVVSNHGFSTPSLFLNKNGSYEDHSPLLGLRRSRDWHGITVVDLDNDGDKDIAIAGGGGGGIQEGAPNLLYRNLLVETCSFVLKEIAMDVGIVNQRWRGRHFLPSASFDGTAVDLYFVCRPREEITNLYFLNTSTSESIVLKPDSSLGLSIQLRHDGRGDCFLDFDRDGDRDLFVLDNGHLVLYENKSSFYYINDKHFSHTSQIETLAVGDLNRDGFPDLYLGARARNSGSDRISFGSTNEGKKLHFFVSNKHKNENTDTRDRVDFKSNSSEIHIDFIREPGLSEDDPSDIFLGRNNLNPASRAVMVSAETARGEPTLSVPGTYLWNDGSSQWSIVWLYGESPKEERGILTAANFDGIEPKMLETFPKDAVSDLIFLNQRGLGFRELKSIDLTHQQNTRAVAVEDFNNDGWPDIIGIRGDEPGASNGRPFIFLNNGQLSFETQSPDSLDNREDDIGQADQMIAGFVNPDGLLDIFMTNGFGLIPGNRGPYKLFLNRTATNNNYVIIELQGSKSNRDALGAQVELYDKDGALLGYKELGAGFNTMQNTHKLHFGLGSYSGKIDAEILWPSGHRQIVNVQPNKNNHIVEDSVR
jgi:hypothetical protein